MLHNYHSDKKVNDAVHTIFEIFSFLKYLCLFYSTSLIMSLMFKQNYVINVQAKLCYKCSNKINFYGYQEISSFGLAEEYFFSETIKQ